jgi:hypothetical protein
MRTNIVLNDQLVEEAFSYANVKSKRELIEFVLQEFVKTHRRLDVSKLPGTVKLRDDYDYKNLRARS